MCRVCTQGTCESRRLHNVSEFRAYRADIDQFVASNDPGRPTVAFLGPGSTRGGSRDHDDVIPRVVMYVGISFSGEENAEHDLRLYSSGISSRALPPHPHPFHVSCYS